ncbi:MAG TPA: hypothetical protein VJS17_07090, partial [Pyrinomonadaceae bacterium]|nr:hypothetical protein [Pyrinomonadaceae bacterium]
MRSLKQRILTSFVVLVAAMLFPSTFNAQTRSYTAENVNYVLVLPSPQWRAINVPGIAHDNTEFRYGDQVKLRIRRELVNADVSVTDLIQRQQQADRTFFRGYVKEKVEPFQGRLNGATYAYEYVTNGELMARLVYYLEANNHVIYRLEFAGSPDQLKTLSKETDLIARSFRLK